MHDLSRRDLFRGLAGASLLELARYRAAWARAMAPQSDAPLFDIEKNRRGSVFRESAAVVGPLQANHVSLKPALISAMRAAAAAS